MIDEMVVIYIEGKNNCDNSFNNKCNQHITMRRPFENIRPKGPFLYSDNGDKLESPVTIRDIRDVDAVRNRVYNPREWYNVEPERLYHNTTANNFIDKVKSGRIDPEGRFDEFFTTAAPEEQFGDFTIVFDGHELVDLGFSPRTHLITGEEDDSITITTEIPEDSPLGPDTRTNTYDIVDTNIGRIVLGTRIGCIPDELYRKYGYPLLEDRCGGSGPFTLYTTFLEKPDVGISFDEDLSGDRVFNANLGEKMQQTFTISFNDTMRLPDVKYVIYADRGDNEGLASEASDMLGSEYMTMKKATKVFPEILSPKPAYELYK